MSTAQEVHEARMILASQAIINKWETVAVLTEDIMCEHMEALLSVMEGKTTIIDLKTKQH